MSFPSIDPDELFKLPMPMQREGVLLLIEAGMSRDDLLKRTGLSDGTIRTLLADRRLHTRDGNFNGPHPKGDEE